MEQHIKLFFMNLMKSFFDNNVNLKFGPNLELEMIKLPDLLALSWLVWSSIANLAPKTKEKSTNYLWLKSNNPCPWPENWGLLWW